MDNNNSAENNARYIMLIEHFIKDIDDEEKLKNIYLYAQSVWHEDKKK